MTWFPWTGKSIGQRISSFYQQSLSLGASQAQKQQAVQSLRSLDQPLTLDKLPLNQPATVIRVGGEKRAKRRLLEMGMLPGERIFIKKMAPLGDPLELEVKHYQLSLRKHEAQHILVELA